MQYIVCTTTRDSALANNLPQTPTIRVYRLDTDTQVVTDDFLTDVGADGLHTYTFEPANEVDYWFLVNADPCGTGQTDLHWYVGGFTGPDAPAGPGGRGKGKKGQPNKGWPRRLKIDRRIYDVRNEWELRQILERFRREQQQKLEAEESKPLTPTRARNIRLIKSKITRAETRVERVVEEIQEQEEEILMLVALAEAEGQQQRAQALPDMEALMILLAEDEMNG